MMYRATRTVDAVEDREDETMTDEEHTGGCLCGALRYRASGAPERVGICHCETCRRNTGAPFAAFAVFARERFAVLSGETGFFQSSPEGKRHFCRACGSPIYWDWSNSDEVDVTLDSLDEPERMRPSYELWTIRRQPWLPETPELTGYQRDRPE